MSSEPASTNIQGASVSGQASPPCRHSPVPLFLSWAPLILASGWQCPAIPSGLLNKITSAKRKKERSEKRILSRHTEKREARLPDSMEFLGRNDAGSVLWMGTLADPQKLRVRTIALDFMIAWASLWEILLAYHFHNTPMLGSEEYESAYVSMGQLVSSRLRSTWEENEPAWTVREVIRVLSLRSWAHDERTEVELESESRWDEGSGFLQEIPLSRFFKDDRSGTCDDVREGTLEWQYMQVTDMRKYLDPPQE